MRLKNNTTGKIAGTFARPARASLGLKIGGQDGTGSARGGLCNGEAVRAQAHLVRLNLRAALFLALAHHARVADALGVCPGVAGVAGGGVKR